MGDRFFKASHSPRPKGAALAIALGLCALVGACKAREFNDSAQQGYMGERGYREEKEDVAAVIVGLHHFWVEDKISKAMQEEHKRQGISKVSPGYKSDSNCLLWVDAQGQDASMETLSEAPWSLVLVIKDKCTPHKRKPYLAERDPIRETQNLAARLWVAGPKKCETPSPENRLLYMFTSEPQPDTPCPTTSHAAKMDIDVRHGQENTIKELCASPLGNDCDLCLDFDTARINKIADKNAPAGSPASMCPDVNGK